MLIDSRLPVKVFDDLISPDLLGGLQKYFESQVRWEFGSQSDKKEPQFGHWNSEFLNSLPDTQESYENHFLNSAEHKPVVDVWKVLKSTVLDGHELVRLYSNAHTYGTEGYPHTDTRRSGNRSTVIYLNPTWRFDWGGETVFADEVHDIVGSILPKPGRVISFDSRITHVARGVSRRCPALRVCLVVKTKIPGCQQQKVAPAYIDFLKKADLHNAYHGRRASVLDHLVGTHGLLQRMGATETTCKAGLFYLAYDQEQYPHATSNGLRASLRELLGDHTESRVYLGSLIQRTEDLERRLLDRKVEKVAEEVADVLRERGAKSVSTDEALSVVSVKIAGLIEEKKLHSYPNLGQIAKNMNLLNEFGLVPGDDTLIERPSYAPV